MISVKSYAKLNLYLNIVGKRQDGYHLIDSLFVYIDLYDLINIKINKTGQIGFSCNQQLLNNSDNLCYKAAQLFLEKYNITDAIDIDLVKNIPVGAGLGGGSANAAIILKTLYQLFDVKLIDAELNQLALQLGADVPFFCQDNAAFVSGIGENIVPIAKFVQLPCLLIVPSVNVETAKIFKAYQSDYDKIAGKFKQPLNKTEIFDYLKNQQNSLQATAIKQYPQIATALKLLQDNIDTDAIIRMTGSGGCCFALFKQQADLQNIYTKLNKAQYSNKAKLYDLIVTHTKSNL